MELYFSYRGDKEKQSIEEANANREESCLITDIKSEYNK